MMFEDIRITVWAESKETEKNWTSLIQNILAQHGLKKVYGYSNIEGLKDIGELLIVESSLLPSVASTPELNRRKTAIVAVVKEDVQTSEVLGIEGTDDFLVYPFRPAEVVSKLRHYHHIVLWNEAIDMNSSIAKVLSHLTDDLQLAERIQKSKLLRKVQNLRGFKVTSRYLAGLRSGGDYFDVTESSSTSDISLLLSDASSYGLSAAFLTILMRTANRLHSLQGNQAQSISNLVRHLSEQVQLTLRGQELFSLFFGTISRQDLKLRYINFGNSQIFYSHPGETFVEGPIQSPAILRDTRLSLLQEEAIQLQPSTRVVIISQGFASAIGDSSQIKELLDRFVQRESTELFNEILFQVKSKLGEDDLPPRDCTVLVVEVEPNILRLQR